MNMNIMLMMSHEHHVLRQSYLSFRTVLPLETFCLPTFSFLAWIPFYVSTVPSDYLYYSPCCMEWLIPHSFACLFAACKQKYFHTLTHMLLHMHIYKQSSQGLLCTVCLITWRYMNQHVCIFICDCVRDVGAF